MTKYQKQTIQYSLEEEKKILDTLKRDYKEARKTIESRIKNLMKREDADLIHVIYQVNYQKALKSQIDDVLDKLNDGTYSSILKYMEDSYGTGFTSSLYRLQKQGVPLIFPMNREEILRAVQTNSKISKKKYGKNFTKMKNTIRKEVTRGISTSMSFGDIARNIDNRMKSGLYNSYRVARTEGHRINQEASFDAMTKAKEAGADVVKKWDSTLDGRTRETHRNLEGQIRELDDPFEVNGKQAMYPSGFGIASEDINCRCVVLEIGRWELDEDDTYSKFDGDSGTIVSDLSDSENYKEFRKNYNRNVELFNYKLGDDGEHYISDKRFESLTINARKNGAMIVRGTPEIEEHLRIMGATASCMNDTIIFRKNVTISEVLEEVFHFNQYKNKRNFDKDSELMTLLNEIEAKEYLLNSAKKYKIPRKEIERISKQLENYKKELKKYYEVRGKNFIGE